MKLRPKRLRVFPNPWCVDLDSQGRPCGVVPVDTDKDGGDYGRLVGARPDAVFVNPVDPNDVIAKHDIRSRRQDTGYKFLGCSNREIEKHELAAKLAKCDPVDLPGNSDHYMQALKDGSLLPADPETAKFAGVKFEAAETLFRKLSEAAEKRFNAHFDKDEDGSDVDAYGHFVELRGKVAAVAKGAADDAKKVAAQNAAALKASQDQAKRTDSPKARENNQ